MILGSSCVGLLPTSFGHLAMLEVSRDGGNTARGIYLLVIVLCSRISTGPTII